MLYHYILAEISVLVNNTHFYNLMLCELKPKICKIENFCFAGKIFSLNLMVWKQEDHKNFIFQHHYDEHMFITQQS